MKRKIMILLIAGIMVIGSLSGCSSASNDEAETETLILTAEEADRLAEEAARLVEEEAEARANEYYEAGYAYLYGLDGKEVDLESAYTNYEKAAELGHAEAMTNIGWMYDNGCGVEQDYEMAFEWYEKAADLDN